MITNDAAKASESKEIQRLKVHGSSALKRLRDGAPVVPQLFCAQFVVLFDVLAVTLRAGHYRQAEGGSSCR